MTVTERTAYLKGLAEGLKLDDSTKEGKILKAVIDTLEDMAASITDLEDGYDELAEYVESIDESLVEVEEAVFGKDDEYDEDYDDDYFEVECPKCNETICIDYGMCDEDEIKCPSCGGKVKLDLEDICECAHDNDKDSK